MSPDVAAKLVEALDRELARRRKVRDEAEEKTWREEADGDEVYVFARVLDRFASRLQEPPAGPFPLDNVEIEVRSRQVDELAEEVYAIADMLERDCAHAEAVERGEPRREPIVLRPARSAYKPVLAANVGMSPAAVKPRKSRTELHLEKVAEEASARQALSPAPGLTVPPSQTELGWHRGQIVRFDQIGMIGVVKLSGVAGVTEAPIVPGAARRGGVTNFFPGDRVDVKLIRHREGFVVVEDVRLASGLDPAASAAEQAAAEAERFRVKLGRGVQ